MIILISMLFFVVVLGVWHTSLKPMQEGMDYASEIYYVNEEDIDFLYDVTYKDFNGNLVYEQEIFDKIYSLVDNSNEFIWADFFLMGSEEGSGRRDLAQEFSGKLKERKGENGGMIINFVTDPINFGYFSEYPPVFKEMEDEGINVVITDLAKMRDPNPIYSSFWRFFLEDYGVPYFECDLKLSGYGKEICPISFLYMINAKANHRKIFLSDDDGVANIILTSANPDNYGSGYSNVGVLVRDNTLANEIIESEEGIADFSYGEYDSYRFEEINNSSGDIAVQFLSEGKIKEEIIKEIRNTKEGESINLAMFLLTDSDVISELSSASNRGVNVEIVLDPSNDLFKKKSKGVPNVYASKDLIEKSDGKINIRWYNTGGQQFHPKMIVIKKNDGKVIIFIGSANMTRRNIGNFNGEADLKIISPNDSIFANEVDSFLYRIWNNVNGEYSVEYERYTPDSYMDYMKYKVQESTGFGAF